MSRKKPPKKKLKYTCWRKNRHGFYEPFARYKHLEVKLENYTVDDVVLARQALKIKDQEQNQENIEIDCGLITFEQVFEKWVQYKKKKIKRNTLRVYKNVFKNHISPHFEFLSLSELNRESITKIIDEVFFAQKKRTSQMVYHLLSNFFTFLINEKFITENPFTNIAFPKHKPKEVAYLTLNEAKIFLEKIKESKHCLMFELALMTGMRPEEYFALRWKDIDFTNKIISVRVALDLGIAETVLFHELKSDQNSRRNIPISADLIERLKKHRKEQQKTFEYNFNLVFCARNGKPLRLNNLSNRHFKPIIKKITNKNLSLYSLRHTCATLLSSIGENPKIVSERLGNSVEVTLKTYSHVSPNLQKSASEKLEKMLN